MRPYVTVEADASNADTWPASPALTVNDATGAWSGTMATPKGLKPTPMAVPVVLVARAMGVTVLAPLLAT